MGAYKKVYSTKYTQAVTNSSTNMAQCGLTSVISGIVFEACRKVKLSTVVLDTHLLVKWNKQI